MKQVDGTEELRSGRSSGLMARLVLQLQLLVLCVVPASAQTLLEEQLQTLPLWPLRNSLDVAGDFAVSMTYGFELALFQYDGNTGSWLGTVTGSYAVDSVEEPLATDGDRIVWAELEGGDPSDVVVHSTRASNLSFDQILVDAGTASVVDMDLVGGLLVIGVSDAGSSTIETYLWSGASWVSHGSIAVAGFGSNDSLATDGTWIAWGRPVLGDDGGVELYRRIGGVWTQQQSLAPDYAFQTDAGFGREVAFGGGCLFVGAPLFNRGIFTSAYVDAGIVAAFGFDGQDWVDRGFLPLADVLPADARFGSAIDADELAVAVGSPRYVPDAPDAVRQGRLHVFTRSHAHCGAGIQFVEAYRARTSQLANPATLSELGERVGVAESTILVSDRITDRVYSFPKPLFVDGFESGDTTAWQ